jgi:hypothetical protein
MIVPVHAGIACVEVCARLGWRSRMSMLEVAHWSQMGCAREVQTHRYLLVRWRMRGTRGETVCVTGARWWCRIAFFGR